MQSALFRIGINCLFGDFRDSVPEITLKVRLMHLPVARSPCCSLITSLNAFSQLLSFFFFSQSSWIISLSVLRLCHYFFLQPYGHTRGEILLSLNYNPGCNTLTVGITRAKHLIHFDAHSNRGE